MTKKSKGNKRKNPSPTKKKMQGNPTPSEKTDLTDPYHVDGPDAGGEPGPCSSELAVETRNLLSQLGPSVSPTTQKNAIQTLFSKISSPFVNKQIVRAALDAESASLKQEILDKLDKMWEADPYLKKNGLLDGELLDSDSIIAQWKKEKERAATSNPNVPIVASTPVNTPFKMEPFDVTITKEYFEEKEIQEETEREERKLRKQRADKAFETAMADCEKKMKGLDMDTTNSQYVADKRKQIKAEMLMMQDFVKKLNTDKQDEIDAGLTDDETFLQVPKIPDWIIAMEKRNLDKGDDSDEKDNEEEEEDDEEDEDWEEDEEQDEDDDEEDEEDDEYEEEALQYKQTLPTKLEQYYASLVDYDDPFAVLKQHPRDPHRISALKYWLALQRQRAAQEGENTPMMSELAKTPLRLFAHCLRKTVLMNDGVDVEYRHDGLMRRIKGGMWVDMGLEEKFGIEVMTWLFENGVDVDEWLKEAEQSTLEEDGDLEEVD